MIQEPLRRRCLSPDEEAGPEKIPGFPISWGRRRCYFLNFFFAFVSITVGDRFKKILL